TACAIAEVAGGGVDGIGVVRAPDLTLAIAYGPFVLLQVAFPVAAFRWLEYGIEELIQVLEAAQGVDCYARRRNRAGLFVDQVQVIQEGSNQLVGGIGVGGLPGACIGDRAHVAFVGTHIQADVMGEHFATLGIVGAVEVAGDAGLTGIRAGVGGAVCGRDVGYRRLVVVTGGA